MKCTSSLKPHCREMARKRKKSAEKLVKEPKNSDEYQGIDDEYDDEYEDTSSDDNVDVNVEIIPSYEDKGIQNDRSNEELHKNLDSGFSHSSRRSSIECTFATLMAGSSFEQMQKYNTYARNYFPSKGAFYTAQKKIGEVVKNYAEESMRNARMQMCSCAQISADGRY